MFFRQKKSYFVVVSLLSVVNVLNIRKKFVLCDDAAAAPNSANVPTATDDVNRIKETVDTKTKHTKKENPFDCIKPACASKMDMLQSAIKQRKIVDGDKSEEVASSPSTSQEPVSIANSSSVVELNVENIESPSNLAPGCPLYIEELGRSSWDLIHTMAAYYPDTPNEEDKKHATNFMISMAYLYPCDVCRKEFIESVEKVPPE